VGALYYDNNDVHSSDTIINNATQALVRLAQISKQTTDFGVFGEATLPFADTWRLTAGLRYDQTKINSTETFTSASNPFGLAPVPNVISTLSLAPDQGSNTFNNVTFKARIEKDLTASNLLYASIATGFLPGDVQLTLLGSGLASKPGAVNYAQEKLTAYEIGSKNRFLDDRLQLNGAVFYYDYSGYQTSTRTSPLTTSLAIVTSPAQMYGGELAGIFQLTANDRVGVAYAYTHSAYVNEPSCPGSTTTICFAQVIANAAIANVAPSVLTANYDHSFHLVGGSLLDFHADARFASAHDDANFLPAYIPYEPYVHVDGQWIGDLAATWTSPNSRYSLTGYMRNVTNNVYANSAVLAGIGTTFAVSSVLQNDPRTWGVIVHASF
jgi:iron complex outermembrane receptor protein